MVRRHCPVTKNKQQALRYLSDQYRYFILYYVRLHFHENHGGKISYLKSYSRKRADSERVVVTLSYSDRRLNSEA